MRINKKGAQQRWGCLAGIVIITWCAHVHAMAVAGAPALPGRARQPLPLRLLLWPAPSRVPARCEASALALPFFFALYLRTGGRVRREGAVARGLCGAVGDRVEGHWAGWVGSAHSRGTRHAKGRRCAAQSIAALHT